ncbi:hypothetical protein C0585_01205 [Candidatus Woesearchaeota archaeon]|nr:MAG: hypothetical protein C0585_01205 [Candidatus Woesearchaeota archaeon]
MEVVSREEVLEAVKSKGPILPREIVKILGKSDTFMVGAVLSELINNNQVKVTNTKIGASPTYYILGQEMELQNLAKHLNEKDKRAYDLLYQKKILRDSKLEPLVRVSLRAIKDFSKPLEINVNGQKEIFWKWYMLKNDEAIKLIKEMFKPKEPEKIQKEEPVLKISKPEPIKEDKNKEEPRQEFTFKSAENEPKEMQESLNKKENLETTEFLSKIKEYFHKNNIKIIEEFLIKKNKEYDFLIKIFSPLGELNYYCKAKDKKKNNETDVGAAYMQADQYRLPTIYLTTGEFTKKSLVELEKFKQVTIKILE